MFSFVGVETVTFMIGDMEFYMTLEVKYIFADLSKPCTSKQNKKQQNCAINDA